MTPPPSVGDKAPRSARRRTLAEVVLLKMALRLSVVTVILTALSYAHIVRSVTTARERDLLDYIRARGEREAELFRLAEDHHKIIAAALLERLRAMGNDDPIEEFERRYKVFPDGVLRCRPEGFDPTKRAQVFIDDGTPKTPETRRTAIAVQDTMTTFGRAIIIRFIDTWMVTPDNININYWPSVPQWMYNTAPDNDFTKEEFYTIGTPAENPSRETVWTKNYIDPQAKICMVSAVTPVYDEGRFLGVVGHDIALQDLVRRTVEEKLAGAYNVLLRKDGHLIAHPTLAAAIEEAGGEGDVGARRPFRLARDAAVAQAGAYRVYSPDGFSGRGAPAGLVEPPTTSSPRASAPAGQRALRARLLRPTQRALAHSRHASKVASTAISTLLPLVPTMVSPAIVTIRRTDFAVSMPSGAMAGFRTTPRSAISGQKRARTLAWNNSFSTFILRGSAIMMRGRADRAAAMRSSRYASTSLSGRYPFIS